MGLARLGLLGLVLCSAFAWGEESVSALEFWFYRPSLPIRWNPTQSARDISLGGGVTAFGSKGVLDVTNMRWEDGSLRVDSLAGALLTDRIAGELSVVGIKQELFSFRNIRVDIASKRPLELTLPDEIRMTVETAQGRSRFALADDGFKTHIDAQIDALFRDYDLNFTNPQLSGDLGDMARQYGNALLSSAKSQLMDQARDELKKALSREQLARTLVSGTQSMPAGLPPEVMRGDWIFRRILAQGRDASGRPQTFTLWRLAPAGADSRGNYTFPPASANSRNVFTVVAAPGLIQSLSEKSLLDQANSADKQAVVFGAQETQALARVFGFEANSDRKWELVAAGKGGPQFRVWMHRTQDGALSYSDLVWTVREQGGSEEHRLGMVVEYAQSAQPRLKAAFILHSTGAKPIAPADLAVLRTFIDPRLSVLTQNWGTGNEQLKPTGIRAIGLADGVRSQGNGFIDQWAKAIGLDYALSPL
jgi:hypothetical protein